MKSVFKNKRPRLEEYKKPVHIAFIMDGNGRWAKRRGLPRTLGHLEGFKRVREIAKECRNLGIKYMSLFAFSTENWSRPKDEVDFLWKHLDEFLKTDLPSLIEDECRLVISGDISRLPLHSQEALEIALGKTENFSKYYLNLCLNYGGQDDLVQAVKKIINEKIPEEKIDKKVIQSHLYAHDFPSIDLLVRTSGEKRLSNFMLYQLAYSELDFPKTYWPSYTKKALWKSIKAFNQRHRRFGGL